MPRKADYAAFLRRKLAQAVIVLRDDIPPDVVTLNSRIVYAINDETCGQVLLVPSEGDDFPNFALSLYDMKGLALIGLGEGGSADLPNGDRLTLVSVLHQPERDKRNTPAFMQDGVKLRLASSVLDLATSRRRPA
ncbi:hypothetical protein [Oryzicola mucosus]|uniref:Uncharacterized protein n=1 Tax=Oryzicola mucosus TaxID=2767425 RepID=A0A8J6PTJ7_9HYPH|nr:hypothetical protein [Oryzicola mucosus]MBD0413783.1 hypothetical protein [Oryzicola mucosus]